MPACWQEALLSHMQDRQMTLQTVQSVYRTPVRQHRQKQFNQGTGRQDENTALHVGVNYLYNAEGDISAFAMDLKNFEDRRRVLTVHIPTQAVICGGTMTGIRPVWLVLEAG